MGENNALRRQRAQSIAEEYRKPNKCDFNTHLKEAGERCSTGASAVGAFWRFRLSPE